MPRWNSRQLQGIAAALLSAVVLGLSPVFGKQAISAGTPWLTVVTFRTIAAASLLWLMYLLVPGLRKFIYIYPVGLVGSLTAGFINGLGSLLYYNSLGRLDASLAQLIYMMYPLFVTLLARLDGYTISRLTLVRLLIALTAVYFLVGMGAVQADGWGVWLMVASSLTFALHLLVNQRMLLDMPAPTVALYTLTAMAVTVAVAYILNGFPALPPTPLAWEAVGLLTFATLTSRLMLFMGMKRLGGVQAALINLNELLVAVVGAHLLLSERLTALQWLGAILLGLSVLLIARERSLGQPQQPKPWLQILTARLTDAPIPTPPQPHPPVKPPAPKPRE
jgi:drug/metabolite transporter (DMT)-like permease